MEISRELYELVYRVVSDAEGNMECNCGAGGCEGNCTHAEAANARMELDKLEVK